MRWLLFADVVLYALVASQHAFYLLGLEATQRRLSGAAWVELRNALDAVLTRSLPALYVATLVATVLTLLVGPARLPTAVALAALLVEAWLMLKRSVPINAIIRTWSPGAFPEDWTMYRTAWLRAFHRRQVAVAIGFASLLLAVLAH